MRALSLMCPNKHLNIVLCDSCQTDHPQIYKSPPIGPNGPKSPLTRGGPPGTLHSPLGSTWTPVRDHCSSPSWFSHPLLDFTGSLQYNPSLLYSLFSAPNCETVKSFIRTNSVIECCQSVCYDCGSVADVTERTVTTPCCL